MTLYISNPSRQPVVFYYRKAITRDTSQPHSVHIAPGCQEAIGQNWSREEKTYVISQILATGGADAAEAHVRLRGFTGLLYRDVNPVGRDEIEVAHESVMQHAQERSVKQVTRSALSYDKQTNGSRRERAAKVTGVEIKQELARGQRVTGDEVHFDMTIDPDGSTDARGILGIVN